MKNILKSIIKVMVLMFCFSTFFSQKTYSSSIKNSDELLGDFIKSSYNIFYNQKPDLNNFTYLYDSLKSGQLTLKDFVIEFIIDSPEFPKHTKLKQDFLEKIYKLLLDREIDIEGEKYWSEFIDNKFLYYFRKENSNFLSKEDILTLCWNINTYPSVLREVANKIMESDEFITRGSFMNVKINKGDKIIVNNRSDAKSVYKTLSKSFKNKDYTKEVLNAKKKEQALRKSLTTFSSKLTLKDKIISLLGDNLNKVSVSFYDIKKKNGFDINGDTLFKAGSTYKVPLNIILYDLIYKGEISPNDLVEYNHEKHFEDGAGLLKDYIVDEMLFPQRISDLSRLSIINSDNIAGNMLISEISKHASIYGEYGKILGYPLNRTGNLFSTNEMNEFLKKLYFNKDNNPYYGTLLGYLKRGSAGVRISRYIPKEIVASKYGSYQGNYHDIGIVFGEHPFILSIFTRDIPNAEQLIADISKLIYEELK